MNILIKHETFYLGFAQIQCFDHLQNIKIVNLEPLKINQHILNLSFRICRFSNPKHIKSDGKYSKIVTIPIKIKNITTFTTSFESFYEKISEIFFNFSLGMSKITIDFLPITVGTLRNSQKAHLRTPFLIEQ